MLLGTEITGIDPGLPPGHGPVRSRLVIAGMSNFTDVGDITTLANLEVVDQIRDQVQNAKKAHGEVPGGLSATESEEISKFASAG